MNNFLLFQPADSHERRSRSNSAALPDDLENIEQRLERTVPSVTINDWVVMERSVPCLVGRTIGHQPSATTALHARLSSFIWTRTAA